MSGRISIPALLARKSQDFDGEAHLTNEELDALVEAVEALDRGRRFERFYQESLGATWTKTQQEILDSLQSAFLEAHLDALARFDFGDGS